MAKPSRLSPDSVGIPMRRETKSEGMRAGVGGGSPRLEKVSCSKHQGRGEEVLLVAPSAYSATIGHVSYGPSTGSGRAETPL